MSEVLSKLSQDSKELKLPSLPAVAIRILDAIKKGKSFEELAKIINADPALSAKLLKIANSAFFALPKKVDSLQKAVSLVGTEMLKNIALSFVIVKHFSFKKTSEKQSGTSKDNAEKRPFDYNLFWERALTAAVAAKMLAPLLNIKGADPFTTALLMDMGIMVMYLCKPHDYTRVLEEKMISDLPIIEAEHKVFSFDHQTVGSEILELWRLPESIYMPIKYHHFPQKAPSKYKGIAELLHLADIAASIYHSHQTVNNFNLLKETLIGRYGFSPDDFDDFIDSIAQKTTEIISLFEVSTEEIRPYSQLLQEANEELGKLNLSYEQLLIELKQEKEKAERLAQQLKKANKHLRELALRDGLTGLYNHRFFQELLDKELNRAQRYGRSLSLVMIDIDFFKKVNDTYGHLTGDLVLKHLVEIIKFNIRKSDFAARYGGEEFIIILPDTDLKGAVTFAERLRDKVENISIKINKHTIKITISCGVTTYWPQLGFKTKAEIIETVDKALYISKTSGRNRVTALRM